MTGLNWLLLLLLATLQGCSFLFTAIAFVVWFCLIRTAGPSNTAQVTLLVPVIALLFGHLVLGEVIESNSLIGLGLILTGVACIQMPKAHS